MFSWVSILGGLVKLASAAVDFFTRLQAKKEGITAQKEADESKEVEILNAEQKADADGPHDADDALKRLRDGNA